MLSNVRFTNGYAERFSGMASVFTAPAVTPYFLIPYQLTTVGFWVHAGLLRSTLTMARHVPTSPALFYWGIDDKWTGGVIGPAFWC